jgi:quercetin dioxygenase-like cupin family protein
VQVIRGRRDDEAATRRTGTVEGDVWGDPVVDGAGGVTVNNVWFAPGGRTHWHRHEGGQLLQVSAGEGWVGVRGEPPVAVRAGDVVWCPPGEEHWHGAGDAAPLVHLAVSVGRTQWQDAVRDQEGELP